MRIDDYVSPHSGEVKEGDYFRAKCHCGHRGRARLYRYQAAEDLLNHFRAVQSLTESEFDRPISMDEFLGMGMNHQESMRHCLR